jgi:hypothetical protein
LRAELIEEEWGWLGEKMRYFRRPLRDLTEPLASAGFVIERIVEPTPSDELKIKDPKGYDLLCRLPAFLFVRARKLVEMPGQLLPCEAGRVPTMIRPNSGDSS